MTDGEICGVAALKQSEISIKKDKIENKTPKCLHEIRFMRL